MNSLFIVVTLGFVIGVPIGVAVHFFVAPDIRANVERLCLRYGAIASAIMFVPLYYLSTNAILAALGILLGLIAVIPLAAGIALYVARRTASGA